MVSLSVVGVLLGLVPALALGTLINTLVEYGDKTEAAYLSVLIAATVLLEAAAYIASDGLYARNAAHLYRNLRLQMFDGASRRSPVELRAAGGLPSRFISDAETIEQVTVSLLDTGSMLIVEFVSAFVALAVLEPLTAAVAAPMLAATWVVARRMQEPAATAGRRRQEELEHLTKSIARELGRPDAGARNRFGAAAERLLSAEVRHGWLQAANRQGSGGLAKLGPIAVVVAAAFSGNYRAGTLMALYLLAQRAFWGFDGLVDLSLNMQSVRGAVTRCFALIDTPGRSAAPAH
jgi:ABC-type multidrug transport system fused ATPase/permease subunit